MKTISSRDEHHPVTIIDVGQAYFDEEGTFHVEGWFTKGGDSLGDLWNAMADHPSVSPEAREQLLDMVERDKERSLAVTLTNTSFNGRMINGLVVHDASKERGYRVFEQEPLLTAQEVADLLAPLSAINSTISRTEQPDYYAEHDSWVEGWMDVPGQGSSMKTLLTIAAMVLLTACNEAPKVEKPKPTHYALVTLVAPDETKVQVHYFYSKEACDASVAEISKQLSVQAGRGAIGYVICERRNTQ